MVIFAGARAPASASVVTGPARGVLLPRDAAASADAAASGSRRFNALITARCSSSASGRNRGERPCSRIILILSKFCWCALIRMWLPIASIIRLCMPQSTCSATSMSLPSGSSPDAIRSSTARVDRSSCRSVASSAVTAKRRTAASSRIVRNSKASRISLTPMSAIWMPRWGIRRTRLSASSRFNASRVGPSGTSRSSQSSPCDTNCPGTRLRLKSCTLKRS